MGRGRDGVGRREAWRDLASVKGAEVFVAQPSSSFLCGL